MNQLTLTLRKATHLAFICITLTAMMLITSNCTNSAGPGIEEDVDLTAASGIDYTKYTPPGDVPSQNEDATSTQLAEFAWQEFIALNWPAASGSRGLPDTSKPNGFISASAVGGPTYTPVWQTYWHRNELFPAEGKTPVEPATSDATPPNYQYAETYPYGGTGTGDYTLWNNLDEINELGQDVVFAHSNTTTVDSTYQVLYEAKMNFDGASYIYTNKLNDAATRATLQAQTKADISANGVCGADPTKYICLPCGKLNGQEGNIEIKAAWRQLDPVKDVAANFHTQNVIYYYNEPGTGGEVTEVYKNVTMGLVGLHIIHKTETFPDFVYATWEHKTNLSSDIVYTEIQTTAFGDTAKTINEIERTHPIPNSISSVNSTVNQYLAGQNSVWQNYELINVQAKPRDISTVTGSKTDTTNSAYYLSNSVIESNIELQTFTGSTTTPDFENLIYKGNKINMGGCMGCHGNAQVNSGSDFNFLIVGAPFRVPEFTGIPEPGCPPGASSAPINNWNDVVNLLSTCAIQTTIAKSPHHYFWDLPGSTVEENYCRFTNGDAYSGGPRICMPGDSKNSKIIDYLANDIMPGGGGPYFTKEQVDALAKWIDDGCHYDAAGTYTPATCPAGS